MMFASVLRRSSFAAAALLLPDPPLSLPFSSETGLAKSLSAAPGSLLIFVNSVSRGMGPKTELLPAIFHGALWRWGGSRSEEQRGGPSFLGQKQKNDPAGDLKWDFWEPDCFPAMLPPP